MYITLDAGRQIRKLLEKQGMPEGGLRVGVKAGGCSGLMSEREKDPEALACGPFSMIDRSNARLA